MELLVCLVVGRGGGGVRGSGVGGGSRQPEVAAAHLMGRAPELDLFHYRGRAYL